eukprot:GGOE01019776.1.p1 GENE.GGOE01019776.1~~GGOE01019776.1.p1  ORF type:complete len:766 (+),score=216.23 GGOE01019776.1:53-2350(+)
MRARHFVPCLAVLPFLAVWTIFYPVHGPRPSRLMHLRTAAPPSAPATPLVKRRRLSRFEMQVDLQGVEVLSVETLKPPPTHIPQANLTKPISRMYFPSTYASLALHNLPCVGLRDRPVLLPKPLPTNPRFVLLVDSWERQQTGTKTVENAASIVAKFGLVFVMPHVRMSNIQGIPGWTQWRSTHALDGFTAAKYLLPMSEYYDVDYSRGHLPMITFEEFLALSNQTITTALMMDWENNKCQGNRPEWFPANNARIQALQLYCMKPDFPSAQLSQALIDEWFTLGKGTPLPEAAGRPPPPVPSVAFLNWRKHSFGPHVWASDLWRGQCRFRWNPRWNATAVAWAREHLPAQYVAIKIRSGDYFRHYWLPKRREDVQTCFDHMAEAAKYYLAEMGLPPDAPVYLSTEWPNPPESRWHYASVAMVTAGFNTLHRDLNLVTYRNKDLDIGIVTIISFNLLLNAAIVIGLEDTMLGLVRQYNPSVPLAVVGSQSGRKCDNWKPPQKRTGPPAFLYLVQGKKFMEALHFSENSDVLCLTWGEQVSFCDFQPKTTWTSGRNYLWKKAVRLPRKYEYYIFMDDDAYTTSYQSFEDLLLKWRPAVGVPGGAIHLPEGWTQNAEALQITSFDAMLNAYHRDVVFNSLVLPYYDGMDQFSWWTSQLYAIYLSVIFHRDEVYGFPEIGVANTFRGKYQQQWDITVMNKPFIESCMTNETFRRDNWKGFVSEAVIVKQPLSVNRSHALPQALLDSYLNQSTPYWARIREVRAEAFELG